MAISTKKLAIAALAVCVMCGVASAQAPAGSPVALHGQLSVKNGKIVDKNNEPFQMRGMSFFWSTPGWGGDKFYTSGVVNWLAEDWKVDVVRVAMDPGARGAWETVVNAAIAKGLYVIIDWHSHKASAQQSDAQTFFNTISTTYKNTPNVLYEIYNEPCPSGANADCRGETWAGVKTYAQAVVNTIRNNDKNNIIVIGSPDFTKRVDQAAADPVSGDNLAYSVHYYTAEPGTEHQSSLRAWCNQALSKGAALLVTEFGVSEADGGQKNPSKIDTDEADRWFDYLDKNQIGWVNWAINDKGEAASALTGGASASGGWSSGNLSASGKYIRDKLVKYATTTQTITITVVGQGKVTSVPAGPSYKYGTQVTITAVPDNANWAFEGWGGGASGTATTVALPPLYSNLNITATFAEGSMIKNGTFTNNIANWASGGVTLSHDATNGALKAAVASGGSAATRVQQSGIDRIAAGKKYMLSFKAKTASGTRKITARVTNSNRDRNYMDTAAVELTTTWKTFEKEFSMCYRLANGTAVTDSNAVLLFACGGYTDAWDWYLDDVKLNEVGTGSCGPSPVSHFNTRADIAPWSISQAGGALQIRGPIEAGARLSLYDTRGKIVKSVAAKDGMTLNAVGIPAGNYLAVVKNRAGAEVYKTRVSFVR